MNAPLRKIKGVWSNNAGDAKIEQIEVANILNGHENIDANIFVKIKTVKQTRGHDFTLVKWQSKLGIRNKKKISQIEMFKNIIYNYLVRAGYT